MDFAECLLCNITVIGAKKIEGVVGFLDNQKLAGHLSQTKVTADIGILHFVKRHGNSKVFYHKLLICHKGRSFEEKRSLTRFVFGQGSRFFVFKCDQL
jgi:hypothetical protein